MKSITSSKIRPSNSRHRIISLSRALNTKYLPRDTIKRSILKIAARVLRCGTEVSISTHGSRCKIPPHSPSTRNSRRAWNHMLSPICFGDGAYSMLRAYSRFQKLQFLLSNSENWYSSLLHFFFHCKLNKTIYFRSHVKSVEHHQESQREIKNNLYIEKLYIHISQYSSSP